MKIKVINKKYSEVKALKPKKLKSPKRPSVFFRFLMKVLSTPTLKKNGFTLEEVGMERLGKREHALFLMNHSSFTDMKIVAHILYPRPFNIVATTDGFIGKRWLMRQIGCIPTEKFVKDIKLIKDIIYAEEKLNDSVVLFPEAGYSLDGRATVLPDSVGTFVKKLGVPVVMITTYGAFHRDPLYNDLQIRDVKLSARMEYLYSPDELSKMSEEEIRAGINEKFAFDSFRWQRENKVKVSEPFRADGLNRILYKCPACKSEGRMLGKGTRLTCRDCGKTYVMGEYGTMEAKDGVTEYPHIPDWYDFQRESVRRELTEGTYSLDIPVDIYMSIDASALYNIGEGRLVHNADGFHLTGAEGELDYHQRPLSSYTLNVDLNWYEIGDMISIGTHEALYYCFPKIDGDIVVKTRLATEELYKIVREQKAHR